MSYRKTLTPVVKQELVSWTWSSFDALMWYISILPVLFHQCCESSHITQIATIANRSKTQNLDMNLRLILNIDLSANYVTHTFYTQYILEVHSVHSRMFFCKHTWWSKRWYKKIISANSEIGVLKLRVDETVRYLWVNSHLVGRFCPYV